MKRMLTASILILALTVIAAADDKKQKEEKVKDRERTYQKNFDTTWNAAIQAANEVYVVEHSDKSSGIFSFDTGKQARAKRFRIGVTVKSAEENKTTITLRLQVISGPALWGNKKDEIVKKFWDAVDGKLK